MDQERRGKMKGKGNKGGGVCDTEMKKDLVGRWAWEKGFVRIAQFFPETGAGGCAILQNEKTLKKTLDNFRRML